MIQFDLARWETFSNKRVFEMADCDFLIRSVHVCLRGWKEDPALIPWLAIFLYHFCIDCSSIEGMEKKRSCIII